MSKNVEQGEVLGLIRHSILSSIYQCGPEEWFDPKPQLMIPLNVPNQFLDDIETAEKALKNVYGKEFETETFITDIVNFIFKVGIQSIALGMMEKEPLNIQNELYQLSTARTKKEVEIVYKKIKSLIFEQCDNCEKSGNCEVQEKLSKELGHG